MLRKNLVPLTTATAGMSHCIFSVYITALSSRGANAGGENTDQGGDEMLSWHDWVGYHHTECDYSVT